MRPMERLCGTCNETFMACAWTSPLEKVKLRRCLLLILLKLGMVFGVISLGIGLWMAWVTPGRDANGHIASAVVLGVGSLALLWLRNVWPYGVRAGLWTSILVFQVIVFWTEPTHGHTTAAVTCIMVAAILFSGRAAAGVTMLLILLRILTQGMVQGDPHISVWVAMTYIGVALISWLIVGTVEILVERLQEAYAKLEESYEAECLASEIRREAIHIVTKATDEGADRVLLFADAIERTNGGLHAEHKY